jgi:hypothetical protein
MFGGWPGEGEKLHSPCYLDLQIIILLLSQPTLDLISCKDPIIQTPWGTPSRIASSDFRRQKHVIKKQVLVGTASTLGTA